MKGHVPSARPAPLSPPLPWLYLLVKQKSPPAELAGFLAGCYRVAGPVLGFANIRRNHVNRVFVALFPAEFWAP